MTLVQFPENGFFAQNSRIGVIDGRDDRKSSFIHIGNENSDSIYGLSRELERMISRALLWFSILTDF